jgi:osmoprotectant transport system permease protein
LKYKIEKVPLAGICTGILAFGMKYLLYRPNRISSGTGLFTWNVLTPVEVCVLALPWVMCIALGLTLNKRKPLSFLYGLLGNLIIILVFLLTGFSTRRLITPEFEFARVSMGFGSWVMVLSGYILIISFLQDKHTSKTGRFIVSLAGITAVILMVLSGYLDEISILKEYSIRKDRFVGEFSRHLILSGSSVLTAVIIGTPLGIFAFRRRIFEKPVFFIVNSIQTIPSLALFGVMIAPLAFLSQKYPMLRELGIKGVGTAPALIALALYALLPITRNTYTSLKVLDPSVIESARGVGMTRIQLLLNIEIPLSAPIILSGIRISMVQAVGNTTVAALIGAGGFGVFVFQGLGQAVPDLILLGALPVILLAIFIDKIMQMIIGIFTSKGISYELETAG